MIRVQWADDHFGLGLT